MLPPAALEIVNGASGAAREQVRSTLDQDWQAILDRHSRSLLLYARQWCASIHDAEDAVHDGFLRVWRSGRPCDGNTVGRLYMAVKHSALDAGRRNRRRQDRETKTAADEVGASASWFEHDTESAERAAELQRAMETLPIEQREVLLMKIWGDMTFQAIAEALEISPNTAASRYRYALEGLRRLPAFRINKTPADGNSAAEHGVAREGFDERRHEWS